MSRHEEYLLIHAFYTVCLLCIAFITALAAFGILKVYYPNVYARLLVHLRKRTRVAKWERSSDFGRIAEFYRVQATRRKRYRLMFLGMANLYEYRWEQAESYLQSYIAISVGKGEQLRAKNYLAVANLQGGQYPNACRLLEECRRSGKVHIIPYVLSLLLADNKATAQDFYDAFPAPDWANPLMKALLSFDKRSPDTLLEIQRITDELHPLFYLYKSTIREVVNRYETELYFQREDCFDVLRNDLSTLASEISNQPDLFESPRKQWLRKVITELAQRVPDRVIWCENLDKVLAGIAETKYDKAIHRLRWMCNKRMSPVSEQDYTDFYHFILPKTAVELVSYEHFVKYELFKDEGAGLGFQLHSLSDRWDNRILTIRLIPLDEAIAVYDMCKPLLCAVGTVPSDVQAAFHRVLYEVFINRNSASYWERQVFPFIEKLKPQYQWYFEEIRKNLGVPSLPVGKYALF